MRNARHILTLVVTLALASGAAPSLAGTEAAPEVSDIAGDANFVNGQNFADVHQATPGSIESADLRVIWLRTAYSTTVETVDEVRWVRYEPTGLVVSIKTTAPPKPTFGPSVIFRFPAVYEGCGATLEVWLRGSAQGAVDREYAQLSRQGCPGGVSTGLPFSISGNVIAVTLPFDRVAGTIVDGTIVSPNPDSHAHVRTVLGYGATYCCTIPAIDDMPVGTEFIVGSDVPADVNCSLEPDHPDCA